MASTADAEDRSLVGRHHTCRGVARCGVIDRRAQANPHKLLRSDTPPSAGISGPIAARSDSMLPPCSHRNGCHPRPVNAYDWLPQHPRARGEPSAALSGSQGRVVATEAISSFRPGSERDRAGNSTGLVIRELESFSTESRAPRGTVEVPFLPRATSPKTERSAGRAGLTQIPRTRRETRNAGRGPSRRLLVTRGPRLLAEVLQAPRDGHSS